MIYICLQSIDGHLQPPPPSAVGCVAGQDDGNHVRGDSLVLFLCLPATETTPTPATATMAEDKSSIWSPIRWQRTTTPTVRPGTGEKSTDTIGLAKSLASIQMTPKVVGAPKIW